MKRLPRRCFSLFYAVVAVCGLSDAGHALTTFQLQVAPVLDVGDPIEVTLLVDSDRTDIASIGARLTYDPAAVAVAGVEPGAGVPASWSFVYTETTVSGEVDVSVTDQTSAAATIAGPVAGLEAVKVTFTRIGTSCTQSTYDFNLLAPPPGPAEAAFPVNHYVLWVDSLNNSIETDQATTAGGAATGPSLEDHGFIRGNVNNRAAHALDISDVVDLVNTLFGGFVPAFDCDAAFDVNNDGGQNIVDVVALVQGVFGATGFTIPPPNSSNPGPGIPGVGTADGGTIPSVLGCAEGEICL